MTRKRRAEQSGGHRGASNENSGRAFQGPALREYRIEDPGRFYSIDFFSESEDWLEDSLELLLLDFSVEDSLEPSLVEAGPPTESCALVSSEVMVV